MSDLRLGVYLPMAARGIATNSFLDQLVEEAVAAEAAGLDVVLVPEHHVGPSESLGDPMSLTSWLLARTTTIKVGPGVLLLPLYHPVHVAGWSAFLQHASGDRLILGLGTGYQQDDFDLFRIKRKARVALFDEGLAALRSAWRGTLGDRVIPHLELGEEPPIWIGAWSSGGLGRAARDADAWLVDPMRSVDEVASMAAVYRDLCAEAGTPPEVTVIRELWVGETDDAAHRRYLPVVTPVVEYYRQNGALRDSTDPIEQLVEDRVICGSVESVTERLVELVQRTGAGTVVCTLRHPGGPDHQHVRRAIELLGAEVLPAARRALATP